MSSPGDPLGIAGASSGTQSQTNIQLQLLAKLVAAAQASVKGSPYVTYPWLTAGDLTIGTAFPGILTGTVSVRQTVAAAVNVYLTASGGPWIIGDGAGVAAAHNITVLPAIGSGQTIKGAASLVISTNWRFLMFMLDANANWNVLGA